MRANREALRRRRIVPRMLRDVSRARPLEHRSWHADAGATDAGADRRAEDRPRGGRAGHGARRRGARCADDRQHRLALHDRGDRRGGRRSGAALVPALLAQRPAQLLESFVGRAEAAGYEAIVAHRRRLHPGLEAARPAAGPAALPAGNGQRQLLPGPGLPRRAGQAARGGPRRRNRPLSSRPRQPLVGMGGPRAAARADLAADPAQGHPARR